MCKMPKFSVKKPFTIFVAVIAILVLGIVSYTRMTPDLLPNMDFPNVMIMTTYPGANPERVEEEVSKPMEQSMATLEHIKEITSTSSENYSMVMLQFEDSVNMDTIGVDIQQQINSLSAGWDDMVGTPYVLKINPSMLPVEVAAVSMEGMSNIELTDFLNDTLMNALEGIPGVARISTTGAIQQEIHVVLDQKKFDALNEKIQKVINEEIEKTREELEDQKKQLENARGQIRSAQNSIHSTKQQLMDSADDAYNQVYAQLEQTHAELSSRIAALEGDKRDLQRLEAQIAQTEASLDALRQQQAVEPDNPDLALQIMELEGSLVAMETEKLYREVALVEQGIDPDNIDASISQLQAMADNTVSEMQKVSSATNTVKDIGSKGIDMLTSQIGQSGATIDSALTQIEDGFTALEEGRETAIKQADLNNIITMELVTQILAAQNFSMPAGYVAQDNINYMVSVGDEMTRVRDLENLLLFDMEMEGIDPIYLKDVAAIALTDNQNETYTKLNSENGIMLSFEKQSTYATAETTNHINARFRELEEEYPGLRFVALMNQGDYIYMIVDSIMNSLLLGALFAIVVLYLFLKDLRPTFITLCAIPISVIFAIVLMYFSGVTINMISLSGLAVAVGMLVDNSVVVIENIYRLRSKGANAIQAAVSGAQQVAGAVTASTLTTVCVFLPIVFVEGLTRQLFTDLARTMSYSLLASLIVSLTLVPAMASGMLRSQKSSGNKIMDNLIGQYEKLAGWALDHKPVVLAAALILLVVSCGLSLRKGFIFMPEMDMPNVNVSVTMPEGCTMEEASDLADEVLGRIGTIEGIATVGAMMDTGTSTTGGITENTYSLTIYITLSDENGFGSVVGKEIETRCADMPCEVSTSSAMMDMSAVTGSGISVRVYADDMQALQEGARKTAELLEEVEGIEGVSDGLEDTAPALHVAIDRNKAMKKGITVAQIYMELASALTNSAKAATLEIAGNATDVVIERTEGSRLDREALAAFPLEATGRDGETESFLLSDVAEIQETSSLNTIQRISQRRYLTVSGELEEGYNITLVTAQAEQLIQGANLGEGVNYTFTGENETIMEAVEQLTLMLILGVLLVYLVMVAQFQSLKSPFIVMFTIPLAFTGGFLALLLCGMEISVISLIGFVMLTGIIVNNGIVLVDYINQLRQDGMERRAAIVDAGKTRMRPILMTTITTVLGLIDMAVRQNPGTALMRPVAVVCIGGLVYATLMTLFVVPCIYDILNRKELRNVRQEDLELLDF